MLSASTLQFLFQLAKGISRQFGPNCEVVVHDLASNDPETSIVAIENGHVSGRKVGDGASHVVIEQLQSQDSDPADHLAYLTRTPAMPAGDPMCLYGSLLISWLLGCAMSIWVYLRGKWKRKCLWDDTDAEMRAAFSEADQQNEGSL